MVRTDCFALLNVSPNASPEEIRRAYMRLVRRWHPDQYADNPQMREFAQEKLKTINSAYQTVKAEFAHEINDPLQRNVPPRTEAQSKPVKKSPVKTVPKDVAGEQAGHRLPNWLCRFFKSNTAAEDATRPKAIKKKGSAGTGKGINFDKIFNDAVRARSGASTSAQKYPRHHRDPATKTTGPRSVSGKYRPVSSANKSGRRVQPVQKIKKVGKVQ